MLLALIAQGIGYGFTAGTSPGPLQSYLINATLNYGWRKSIFIIFSPLVADGPIILLMTFLLKDLPAEIKQLIQIAGGVFVLWIALGAWRQFNNQTTTPHNPPVPVPQRGIFPQAVVINALSPGPYIFWGTVTGPLLIKGLAESFLHAAAFLLAFYGTFLSLLAAWVLVFDRLRRVDERFTRLILRVTIGVLVVLGGALILQGLGFSA